MNAPVSFRRHVWLLVGFCVVCAAIFFGLFRAGGGQLPGEGGYHVEAVVPTAVALSPGSQVRMAGVEVGRVEEVGERGGNAVVALEIDDEHAPVYRDARVQVRLKSLVGENYVEIDPGTPAAGTVAVDGFLPLENADESTQFDEILSVFDRKSRADLRRVLDGLGGGLDGHGDDLNRLNASAAALVAEGEPVVALLDRQRRQTARLVDDFGRVMQAFGDRKQAIRVFARQVKGTAEAVAARDEFLAGMIDELPSMLRQVESTTTRLGSFSSLATPVVNDLAAGLDDLRPVIRRLRPAARLARTTIVDMGEFSERGVPLLAEFERFSRAAVPLAPALDRMLRQINPMLEYLAPYSRELAAFFANLGSATAYRDATGNVARVAGIYSESSPAFASPEQEQVLDTLFEIGALSESREVGTNAYPAPGQIGDPKPYEGKYPRLKALPPAAP